MIELAGSRCGALVVVSVLAVLGGCATSAEPLARPVPVLPAPRPAGVQDPAVVAAETPAPPCDPLASLRPPASLPAPGQMPVGSTMARIVERGFLRAGVDQNMNLIGFRDRTGQLRGFDIDFVKEIARALFNDRDRVVFRTVTSANREQVLRDGEIDLIANSMTITCDRKQRSLFTTNYFDSGQRVMVRQGSPYRRGIADLGGKRVCAPAGTTSIREIAEADARPVPVAVTDWTDCLVLLQQGDVEAISTTDSILLGLVAQDPTTEMVGDRFTLEPHGLAIALENGDFLRFVNGVLEQMRADGRWHRIYEFWLNDLERGRQDPPPARYED